MGDDWQSIYRFTGSDLSIMTQFEVNFGFCEQILLEDTFRFNDKLCELSTRFILENPHQLRKTLTSPNRAEQPAVTLITGTAKKVIPEILDEIDQTEQIETSVFIIGRYNLRVNQYRYLQPDDVAAYDERYPRLHIRYTTAHRSKGREADYVIVISLKGGTYGFPCEIVDDPLLNLVLATSDPYPNAEERRLFYVAMTRAKKHVYLITDRSRPSSFVSELERGRYDIRTARDVVV